MSSDHRQLPRIQACPEKPACTDQGDTTVIRLWSDQTPKVMGIQGERQIPITVSNSEGSLPVSQILQD